MPRLPDELDGRILKEIQSPGSFRWNVRESYSRMATRLGVDEETVRRRLARLRQEGVIGNFVLLLNPHLLDRECAGLYLELRDSDSKENAISKLKLMDEIISILSLHQAGLLLIIYYKDDTAPGRHVRLIESICGVEASMFWKIPFPPFAEDMSRTDWMIVDSLRKNPRGRLSDIASELKISARTLNRRITRLNEGNAFFLEVQVNPAKSGGFPYLLIVYCEDGGSKREVDSAIMSGLQRLGYSDTSATNHSVFAVACENISESDNIFRWVSMVKGVSNMKAGILERRTFVEHWVDEEIRRRIASFQ